MPEAVMASNSGRNFLFSFFRLSQNSSMLVDEYMDSKMGKRAEYLYARFSSEYLPVMGPDNTTWWTVFVSFSASLQPPDSFTAANKVS